jgi:hypothetical protein
MPVEIFGLQVKRKHISEQGIECAGNLRHGVGTQVGRRIERSDPQRSGILCFRHLYLLFDVIIGAIAPGFLEDTEIVLGRREDPTDCGCRPASATPICGAERRTA